MEPIPVCPICPNIPPQYTFRLIRAGSLDGRLSLQRKSPSETADETGNRETSGAHTSAHQQRQFCNEVPRGTHHIPVLRRTRGSWHFSLERETLGADELTA